MAFKRSRAVIPTRGVKPQGFHSSFLLGISDEVAAGGNKKCVFSVTKFVLMRIIVKEVD